MEDANNKDNVAIGLPRSGGALFWAPLGTTLPTDADTALTSDYTNLGYVTEDGITISTEEESESIIAWGNENVGSNQTGYTKTVTGNLLETTRASVMQFIYGESNVKVNEDGSIESGDTGEILPHGVFVVDTILNNGSVARLGRKVYGDAQLTDRSGDVVNNNTDAVSFPFVLTAFKFNAADGTRVFEKTYYSSPLNGEETAFSNNQTM